MAGASGASRGDMTAATEARVLHRQRSERVEPEAPRPQLADEELVERVRRGDADAYDLLVTRHMKRAFAIAYRLLGHREDAEDLVQESFLVALEKIDTFKTGLRFSPWFFRILVNRGLNARKSRSVRRTDELAPELTAGGASPLRQAEQAELREHLAGVMERLPERQRTVVQLFELEGFSSPEIAEILEVSDGTVRWHLHQARQVLREALAPFIRRDT
jgi:RNA polymerase sigma-70 factor (ECF subfamily)